MVMKLKQTIDDHKKRYYVALAAALVVLGTCMLLVREHTLTGFELDVFRAFNNLPDSWHLAVEILSEVGLVIGVVAAVIVACFKYFRLAWRLIVTVGAAYVASKIVKVLVDRPRPQGMLTELHVRVAETGAGFPSAHATISTAALVTLWPYLPKKWRWVIVPGGVALVAASRMYLGVHSPYDVIGGIALGVVIVSVIRILPKTIAKFARLD